MIVYIFRSLANILIMIPWLTCAIIIGIFHQEAGYLVAFSWDRFFLNFSGIKVLIQNENNPSENLSGCVYTLLSQTSLLDGPVGICAIPRPCRAITNIEYALIPIFGWAVWVFSYVLIRQWSWQSKMALSRVDDFLRNGGNLWVSIEGKRSKNGSLSPYKKGPAVLAIRSEAKIVPVIIEGARECLGYGKWRINEGVVTVRLLPAIATEGMNYDDRDDLVGRLARIAEKELG
jgi:1-acyl-sn-glycerol-3-phosphate acyltransferase